MVEESASVPRSEGFELAKLGASVLLGKRGDALATYLDERRSHRFQERLSRLQAELEGQGFSGVQLEERLVESDETQELLEAAATVAVRSRYDEKISYLARVLVSALRGSSGASLDTQWLRVKAIEDLESVHVQALSLLSPSGGTSWRLIRQRAEERGIDHSVFESCIGLLVKVGLVLEKQELELDLEVDIVEPDKGQMPNETSVETWGSEVETQWRLTSLGSEILQELTEASRTL